MNTYIYGIIIAFVVFSLIGLFAKKEKNKFTGSGKYGVFFTVSGILASFIGGGSIINLLDLSNKYGFYSYADVIPTSVALILSSFFITKIIAANFFSTPKYKTNIAYILHNAVILFLYTLVIVAQFVGLNKIFSVVDLGNTFLLSMATVIVVWLYSLKGFSSVTITDRIQFLVMVFGFYITAIIFSGLETSIRVEEMQFESMSISLILALFLPLFFVPISQEIHQRSASALNDRIIKISLFTSGILYFILGSVTIFLGMSYSGGIEGLLKSLPNHFIATTVFTAIFIALISTIDSALNISSHSFSKIIPESSSLNKLWIVSGVIIILAVSLSSLFPTILSVILLALFIYMSAPAYSSVARIFESNENRITAIIAIAVVSHVIIKIFFESNLTAHLVIVIIQASHLIFLYFQNRKAV